MSDEYVMHEETYKGCTIKIIQDTDAESPREWDNVGTMLCRHSRYNLGDEQPEAEEIIELTKRDDVLWMPLYLYDHSGITISSGSRHIGDGGTEWMSSKGRYACDGAGWDTSTVGIIYCTKERAVKEWGKKKFTKQVAEKAFRYLEGEVKTYADYLEGNVAGFVAEDPDGDVIDSCWGFFPDHPEPWSREKEWEYPISEAKSVIDHWIAEREERKEQYAALT